MAIDETARFELHEGLREVLGEARADALMSLLPPTGWAEVATKHDLDVLRDDIARLEARREARFDERLVSAVDRLEARLMAAFHREMTRQFWALAGTLVAIAGLLTANNVW